MSFNYDTRISNLEVITAKNPATQTLDMNGFPIINTVIDLSYVDISWSDPIAIGINAGQTNQGSYAIAIGCNAGRTNQNEYAIAIGDEAGSSNQRTAAIAIGNNAGFLNQSTHSIAIGENAGLSNQSHDSIAIGQLAGRNGQCNHCIAIGRDAGRIGQGTNAIAIGYQAGQTNQGSNSIILNATGSVLNTDNSNALYIAPIRNSTGSTGQFNELYYNTTNKEVSYLPNDVVDVRTYGAVGNGVADDTTAILNAVSAGRGRVIYFPPGSYRITQTIDLSGANYDRTRFIGGGIGNSRIQMITNNIPIFNIQPTNRTTIFINNVGLSNMTLEYTNPAGQSNPNVFMINCIRPNYFIMENVEMNNAQNYILLAGYTRCIFNSIVNADSSLLPELAGTTVIRFTDDWYLTGGVETQLNGYTANFTDCYLRSFRDRTVPGTVMKKEYILDIEASDGLFFENCYLAGSRTSTVYINPGSITTALGKTFYAYATINMFGNCYFDLAPYIDATPRNFTFVNPVSDISGYIGTTKVTNSWCNNTKNAFYINTTYNPVTNKILELQLDNVNTYFLPDYVDLSDNTSGIGIYVQNGANTNLSVNNSTFRTEFGRPCVDVSNIYSCIMSGNNFLPSGTSAFYYRGSNNYINLTGNNNNFLLTQTPDISFATGATVTDLVLSGNSSQYVGAGSWSVIQPGISYISIGNTAGCNIQGSNSIAIGNSAGNLSQGGSAIAIGLNAGQNSQGSLSVAIGCNAGRTNQGANSVAIGNVAGERTQGIQAVAIGGLAGQYSQSAGSVAIGYNSANTGQGNQAVAVGYQAGQTSQSGSGIAIGFLAGSITQGFGSVAIGRNAGQTQQGAGNIAVGSNAGSGTQGASAVAIGNSAGQSNQGANCIAIGANAGLSGESVSAIAIGNNAGCNVQGSLAIAIGSSAGCNTQGSNAIAIGNQAGRVSMGTNSIAIGAFAGQTGQNQRSIILNATGSVLNSANDDACYIAPLRADTGDLTALVYNNTTKEVSYATTGTKTFVIDHPTDKNKYLQHACLEGTEAGVYYRGIGEVLDGFSCRVKLPDYVTKIGRDFTIHLTPKGNFNSYTYTDIDEMNCFNVYGKSGRFSYLVIGERQMIDVEPSKDKYELKRADGLSPYTYLVKK